MKLAEHVHYEDATVTLYAGDCLELLTGLPDASVDSVVTDPPYGLEFMGKEWDTFRPKEEQWNTMTNAAAAAQSNPETGVSDVTAASSTTANAAVRASESGAPVKNATGTPAPADPARAASATIVDASKIGGFQDGGGGNAYSRSRVRTNTLRHGGDPLVANAGFQQWCQLWTAECLRVLKPGGHMLAFGGTRTWHRLVCAAEDAGFEIRDSIAWLYGSGFPKSLDVSKAIDKAAGVEREVLGVRVYGDGHIQQSSVDKLTPPIGTFARTQDDRLDTAPATPDAARWQGWGTALKPAFEPVMVARKPLVGTVAGNVLAWGTGALNVDACRIGDGGQLKWARPRGMGYHGGTDCGDAGATANSAGRWPANVVLDESQAAALDQMSGEGVSRVGKPRGAESGDGWGMTATGAEYDDSGGASRFFYTAKADTNERPRVNGIAHPTVKPLDLMRWLVRLVTPPGGTVLEPFAGSGTTIEACILEGFKVVAIERDPDYLPLIEARIHRRRDPVEAVRLTGEEGGLFDLLDEGAS